MIPALSGTRHRLGERIAGAVMGSVSRPVDPQDTPEPRPQDTPEPRPPATPEPRPPATREPRPPDTPEPRPPVGGAPAREGSPTPRDERGAVHTPHHSAAARHAHHRSAALRRPHHRSAALRRPHHRSADGRRPRHIRGRVVGWAVLVAIALLLLAWLPRSERPDPPAGQSGRPPPASPTTVPGDD
jgi:hypothetical protein